MLDYQRQLEIEERLKADLERARAEYKATAAEFDSLIREIPSGVRTSDGELRIRQSGEASRAALRNYTLALKRFSQYTLSGIVPEDLQAA